MTGRATKAALSLRPSSRPGSSSQSSTRSFRSCTPSPRAATTTTERTCYFTLPPSAAPAEAGNTITAAQGAFPPSRTVPKHWHSWQPFPTPDSGSRNEWITLTCVLTVTSSSAFVHSQDGECVESAQAIQHSRPIAIPRTRASGGELSALSAREDAKLGYAVHLRHVLARSF